MLTSTTVLATIFCVFNSDGYECSDFEGAFLTEPEAEIAAGKIREVELANYAFMGRRNVEDGFSAREGDWPGSVDVVEITLGQYELPTSLSKVWAEIEEYERTKGESK
jgi:hypothetical protein